MDTDVVTPFRPAGAQPGTVSVEAGSDATAATIDEVDGLLDEVEAALTRLDEGTYGVCSECGAPIDDARLSASPTGLTCSSCEADGSPAPPTTEPVDPAEAVLEDPTTGSNPSPWSIGEFPGA